MQCFLATVVGVVLLIAGTDASPAPTPSPSGLPLRYRWKRTLPSSQLGAVTGLSEDEQLLVVATEMGMVNALHAMSGQVLWSQKLSVHGPPPTVAVARDAVVLSFTDALPASMFALSVTTGEMLWQNNATDNNLQLLSSKAVGNVVVVAGSDVNGGTYGVDATTGAKLWTSAPISTQPIKKAVLKSVRHCGGAAGSAGRASVLLSWQVWHGWNPTYYYQLVGIATGATLFSTAGPFVRVIGIEGSDALVLNEDGSGNFTVVDFDTGAVRYSLSAVEAQALNLTSADDGLFANNTFVFTDDQSFMRSVTFDPATGRATVAGTTLFPRNYQMDEYTYATPGNAALVVENFEPSGDSPLMNLTAFSVTDASQLWQVVHPNQGNIVNVAFFGGETTPGVLYVPAMNAPNTLWSASTGAKLWAGTESILTLGTFQFARQSGTHLGLGQGNTVVAFTVNPSV